MEFTPRTTLTDKAYTKLEELIVTLQIMPGEVLSEAEVASQLNIGRTPIREALYRLSHEGLVRIMARRGYLVTEVNAQKQLKLLEVRRALELILSRSCAKKGTPAELATFLEIAEGMDDAAKNSDELAFMRLDNQFNLLLTKSSRNEYASRAMELLHGLSRRFWFMHFKEVGDLPLCARLHADQARSIAEGDEAKATKATNALIDYTENFTIQTINPNS